MNVKQIRGWGFLNEFEADGAAGGGDVSGGDVGGADDGVPASALESMDDDDGLAAADDAPAEGDLEDPAALEGAEDEGLDPGQLPPAIEAMIKEDLPQPPPQHSPQEQLIAQLAQQNQQTQMLLSQILNRANGGGQQAQQGPPPPDAPDPERATAADLASYTKKMNEYTLSQIQQTRRDTANAITSAIEQRLAPLFNELKQSRQERDEQFRNDRLNYSIDHIANTRGNEWLKDPNKRALVLLTYDGLQAKGRPERLDRVIASVAASFGLGRPAPAVAASARRAASTNALQQNRDRLKNSRAPLATVGGRGKTQKGPVDRLNESAKKHGLDFDVMDGLPDDMKQLYNLRQQKLM